MPTLEVNTKARPGIVCSNSSAKTKKATFHTLNKNR